MAGKGNFGKAIYDVFGLGSEDEDFEPVKVEHVSQAPQPAEQALDPVHSGFSPYQQQVPQPAQNPYRGEMPVAPAPRTRITYIAPDSYMEGTMRIKGDVEVAGDFKGDMTASGSVAVHANINSNITAARLSLLGCTLTGDIHCAGAVIIDEHSVVSGNVIAGELDCAGGIKGDVKVTENAVFKQSSSVEGNITAATMTMERGSSINGSLNVTAGKPQAQQ